MFAGYVPLASQNHYPIIVYSVANYIPHLSHLRKKSDFCNPNLVTFCLCIYLINPFNLVILKRRDAFIQLNVFCFFKSLHT